VAVVAVGAPFCVTFPSDFPYGDFYKIDPRTATTATPHPRRLVRQDGPDDGRVERCHRESGRGRLRASGHRVSGSQVRFVAIDCRAMHQRPDHSATRSGSSLRPDPQFSDDGPPSLGISLGHLAERFRGLALAWKKLLTQLDQP
jgi:hypothetical protein